MATCSQVNFVIVSALLNLSISEAWISCHEQSRREQTLNLVPQQLGSFDALDIAETANRKVLLLDKSGEHPIKFEEAWNWQKSLLEQQLKRLTEHLKSSSFPVDDNFQESNPFDKIIMLQHDPVYTLGTGSDESFITSEKSDVPVVRMDRGGEVTYHGPGQLVVYPILDLRSYRQDIHWYMRALEEVVLRAITMCLEDRTKRTPILPERQDDTTGIWMENRKVAAVGIKCRRWVTMHGVAINIEENSLESFGGIVPCGLEGRKVGCLNDFLDDRITVAEFGTYVKAALEEILCIELVES